LECRRGLIEQAAAVAERINDVTILHRGDLIEAMGPSGNYYHGEVDDISPPMGIVWIIDGSLGFRKMLDAEESDIRVTRRA
jgi:hypothetical protein